MDAILSEHGIDLDDPKRISKLCKILGNSVAIHKAVAAKTELRKGAVEFIKTAILAGYIVSIVTHNSGLFHVAEYPELIWGKHLVQRILLAQGLTRDEVARITIIAGGRNTPGLGLDDKCGHINMVVNDIYRDIEDDIPIAFYDDNWCNIASAVISRNPSLLSIAVPEHGIDVNFWRRERILLPNWGIFNSAEQRMRLISSPYLLDMLSPKLLVDAHSCVQKLPRLTGNTSWQLLEMNSWEYIYGARYNPQKCCGSAKYLAAYLREICGFREVNFELAGQDGYRKYVKITGDESLDRRDLNYKFALFFPHTEANSDIPEAVVAACDEKQINLLNAADGYWILDLKTVHEASKLREQFSDYSSVVLRTNNYGQRIVTEEELLDTDDAGDFKSYGFLFQLRTPESAVDRWFLRKVREEICDSKRNIGLVFNDEKNAWHLFGIPTAHEAMEIHEQLQGLVNSIYFGFALQTYDDGLITLTFDVPSLDKVFAKILDPKSGVDPDACEDYHLDDASDRPVRRW